MYSGFQRSQKLCQHTSGCFEGKYKTTVDEFVTLNLTVYVLHRRPEICTYIIATYTFRVPT